MSGDVPTTLHPTVLWAQRDDCLYVTISLGDVKDKVLDLKDGSLFFSGRSGTPKPSNYAATLEFYAQVDPEGSRQLSTDREIVMCIKKKEPGYWPRLLSSSQKYTWLKVDFNRWKDEDDQEPDMDTGRFSEMLSQMSNMPDMGDDGIDGDLDSDDDLPDLEPPNADAEKVDHNGSEKEEEETVETKA